MRKIILILLASLLTLKGYSQSGEVVISSGDDLAQAIPIEYQFYLTVFSPATIIFNNGDRSNATVNISTFDNTLQFISEQGDTLAAAKNDDVKRLFIGNRFFIHEKFGYIEVMNPRDEISIGINKRLVIFEEKKTGAYGGSSETSSIQSISTYQNNSGTYRFTTQKYPYKFVQYTYIVTPKRSYIPSKKNFIKVFPDKKREIEEYLNTNKIDFNKFSDVEALLKICTSGN